MLPNGRQVLVATVEQLNSRSRNWVAHRWRLETDDGQTLFICKLRRKLASKPASTSAQRYLYNSGMGPIEVVRVGIKIFVCDLEEAKRFYISTLGLTIDKETASSFTASGTLSVYRVQTNQQGVQTLLRNADLSAPLLCLKVKNIEEVCQQLQTVGVKIAEHLSRQHNYQYFRVADPSGNLIELFEGLQPT
jgi:catechol 2,3-dioxygenase-like lactoylglutathione lyase family enzyme